MGVVGGVSGILTAKRWNELDRYIHGVELPVTLILALCFGGGNAVVYIAVFVLVPTFWFSFFRNRCGEGPVWRKILSDRQFIVADAVGSDCDKEKFGRRPVYTRRKDYQESQDRDKNDFYPPAYATGFGFWDLSSWGVGKTPGQSWNYYSMVAFLVLLVEAFFALLALVFGLTGCGLGVFLDLGFATLYQGPSLYLRKRERLVGGLSGFLSCSALAFVWLLPAKTISSQALIIIQLPFLSAHQETIIRLINLGVVGIAIFLTWASVVNVISTQTTKVLALVSKYLLKQRIKAANQSRRMQNVVAANICSTDIWDDMSKCRNTVGTTFPRVDGYSYYDGPQFNVRSGWYFPACGRISLSVPRSAGGLSVPTPGNENGFDDHPHYSFFEQTREESVILGPSLKNLYAHPAYGKKREAVNAR